MKPYLNDSGYLVITLSLNKNRTQKRIHRLVAEAFIPNPENKPEVDHINRIRNDNRVENLRWVSSKENQNNRTDNKQVKCIETGIIYDNPTIAEDILNLPKTSIASALSSKSSRKSTKGYHWEYIKE